MNKNNDIPKIEFEDSPAWSRHLTLTFVLESSSGTSVQFQYPMKTIYNPDAIDELTQYHNVDARAELARMLRETILNELDHVKEHIVDNLVTTLMDQEFPQPETPNENTL